MISILIFASFLLLRFGGGSETLQARIDASLHHAFGDTITIAKIQIFLSRDLKERIFTLSRQHFDRDSLSIFVCSRNGNQMGYGIMDDVKGRSQLITYMVLINPDETLRDVEILIYRESIGGEISNESFRRQFVLKKYSDDLTLGSGIKNISGATISARAITNGVRKLVAAFHVLEVQLPK